MNILTEQICFKILFWYTWIVRIAKHAITTASLAKRTIITGIVTVQWVIFLSFRHRCSLLFLRFPLLVKSSMNSPVSRCRSTTWRPSPTISRASDRKNPDPLVRLWKKRQFFIQCLKNVPKASSWSTGTVGTNSKSIMMGDSKTIL